MDNALLLTLVTEMLGEFFQLLQNCTSVLAFHVYTSLERRQCISLWCSVAREPCSL